VACRTFFRHLGIQGPFAFLGSNPTAAAARQSRGALLRGSVLLQSTEVGDWADNFAASNWAAVFGDGVDEVGEAKGICSRAWMAACIMMHYIELQSWENRIRLILLSPTDSGKAHLIAYLPTTR
jgi:hypothetical protein